MCCPQFLYYALPSRVGEKDQEEVFDITAEQTFVMGELWRILFNKQRGIVKELLAEDRFKEHLSDPISGMKNLEVSQISDGVKIGIQNMTSGNFSFKLLGFN